LLLSSMVVQNTEAVYGVQACAACN
jgi:hypothetical protein